MTSARPPSRSGLLGLLSILVLAACEGSQAQPDAAPPPMTEEERAELRAAIDTYIDERFEGPPEATDLLLEAFARHGLTAEEVEALVRANRVSYPDPPEPRDAVTEVPVDCYHVDYSSVYFIYVPPTYDPTVPTPLVLIGHGGNSSMSITDAKRTARSYLGAYRDALGRDFGAILVAPATTRGWGFQGYSLLFSSLWQVHRSYNVDPDRVYVTGQSMGGHLSYRMALMFADHYGAVSPQSGGYDYVANGTISNLASVPGYVTFGTTEPYDLTTINQTLAAWLEERNYPWVFRQMAGGHDIYAEEQPFVAQFFGDHPREMYRKRAYLRDSGEMRFIRDWDIEGWPEYTVNLDRPLRWNLRHWIEVTPRPDVPDVLKIVAEVTGDNEITILSENVRHARVWLHPALVDLDRPVRILVNGEQLHDARVPRDLRLLLEQVREFEDRGRIYHAAVELDIATDQPVPDPTFPAAP